MSEITTPTNQPTKRFGWRRVWIVLTTLIMGAVLALAGPSTSASADALVEGCHLATCIDAYTGGKNYSNHTQWVGWVDVFNLGGANQVQAWASGYYSQYNANEHWFYIGRWVPSGSAVCGAAVYWSLNLRQIACIGIYV